MKTFFGKAKPGKVHIELEYQGATHVIDMAVEAINFETEFAEVEDVDIPFLKTAQTTGRHTVSFTGEITAKGTGALGMVSVQEK